MEEGVVALQTSEVVGRDQGVSRAYRARGAASPITMNGAHR